MVDLITAAPAVGRRTHCQYGYQASQAVVAHRTTTQSGANDFSIQYDSTPPGRREDRKNRGASQLGYALGFIERYDEDSSGDLNGPEIDAAFNSTPGRGAAYLAALDTGDSPGALMQTTRATVPSFREMSGQPDQRISPAEYAALVDIADRDHDGTLTPQEAEAINTAVLANPASIRGQVARYPDSFGYQHGFATNNIRSLSRH